ncbi:MAG TPA: hypothetical protein VN026_17080, partial [Bacteroidia bacterium]|nr:hypothetical protein [Bacteroidia bacterium]
IQKAYGSQAAYFADPSLGHIAHQTDPADPQHNIPGQMRGDSKHMDSYMSLQLTVGYLIKQKRGKTRLRSKF